MYNYSKVFVSDLNFLSDHPETLFSQNSLSFLYDCDLYLEHIFPKNHKGSYMLNIKQYLKVSYKSDVNLSYPPGSLFLENFQSIFCNFDLDLEPIFTEFNKVLICLIYDVNILEFHLNLM